MESKTKHRLLGVAVVAGLAVLMYPFMAGNNNLPSEKALVKAPDFPEQATQITVGTEDVVGMPGADVATNPPEQNAAVTPQADADVKKDSTNVVNISNVAAEPQKAAAEIPAVVEPGKKSEDQGHITSPIVDNKVKAAKIRSIQKKIASRPVKKLANASRVKDLPVIHSRIKKQASLAAYKNSSVDNNGLMDLKSAAYVIQLGSFKQKANALRLVNKLRAKGYRAFIQSVDSSGGNTRVFVGPEHQQASARLVASQLNKEMQLHGIVISYKPFTL